MISEFESPNSSDSRLTRRLTGGVPIKSFPGEHIFFHKLRRVTNHQMRSLPSGTDITELNRKREIHNASEEGVTHTKHTILMEQRELDRLLNVRNPRTYQLERIAKLRISVGNAQSRIQEALEYRRQTNADLLRSDQAYHSIE